MNPILPRIVVGLGNPGKSYATTRHNIGFMVLDRLAEQWGCVFKADKARKGEVATASGVLLVKPQTFMNESGQCVGALAHYFKISPEQIFVLYDDMAFPLGKIRLRPGGSAGGHNGIKSLISHLGTEKFPRLRIGIGAAGGKEMVSHVLGNFRPDELDLLGKTLDRACEAAIFTLQNGIEAAANKYNATASED